MRLIPWIVSTGAGTLFLVITYNAFYSVTLAAVIGLIVTGFTRLLLANVQL